MDLKWQVAVISMRLNKFYKKTSRRLQFDANEPVGFDKTKVECFNCHKTGYFARECRSKGNQERKKRDAGNTRYKAKDNRRRPGNRREPKALVPLCGEPIQAQTLSFSHLIRDCDFHEKRMAKQVDLNKKKGNGTGQWENRLDNLQRALKNKGIVDSGCSRHMTRNKAYLAEYQDYNGGPVAFGDSKGYLTGKGKMK
ncbi:ribonuclease H-like domain-containing protein [Tanacetum coccineum]